jgi:hypothetical protein
MEIYIYVLTRTPTHLKKLISHLHTYMAGYAAPTRADKHT